MREMSWLSRSASPRRRQRSFVASSPAGRASSRSGRCGRISSSCFWSWWRVAPMAVWTFARLTLREAARSRLLPIVFLLAAAYVGLIGWGAHLLVQYSSSSASAQASAFGLEVFSVYMVSFVVALIAVFITGASTHSEGESG